MISSISAVNISINPTTTGGLSAAIESSNDGDTIYLEKGVYTGENNTNIRINKNITIKGQSSNVVLDGHRKNQIFQINSTVLLKNLKFTNGYGNYNNGGAIHSKGNLTIDNCVFTNNVGDQEGYGGAIASSGSLRINKCTFTNNTALRGGAIDSFGNLTINSCKFTNNRAYDENGQGGAIYSHKGSLTIYNSTFTNNTAFGPGAICSYGSLTINNSTFTNNKAYEHGSGGAIGSFGSSTINSCKFTTNTVPYNGGGAIYSHNGSLTINRCTFTNNRVWSGYDSSGHGGAIYSYSGSLTINSSIFTKNTAPYGGAIASDSKSMTVDKCNFKNNQAKFYGGAIYFPIAMNKIKVAHSKFEKNLIVKGIHINGGEARAEDKDYYNAIYNKGLKVSWKNVIISPKDGTEIPKSKVSKTLKVLSSKAKVSGANVAISLSINKSKIKTGKTVVKLPKPDYILHKSFKVSRGSAKYNAKTKVLTWTMTNKALAKKKALITWNVKIPNNINYYGNFKITPSISSSKNKIINKKTIIFKQKPN